MDCAPVSPIAILASKRTVTKATRRKATKRKTTKRKTTERKTTEKKTTERKTTKRKTNKRKTTERKATERKTTERKATERKTTERKTTERKATERKATERKTTERKTTERKATERKTTERKTTERKATERKTTKRKTNQRKTTPENDPPQKKQRVGEGPDTSTDSAQSTLELVIVINSSSDESTVSSGHSSTVRFSHHSSSPIRASNRPVTKANRRKAPKRKAPKRKTTPENESPVKRQRVGEGPDTSTDSAQSTLVIVINSSSDESTVSSGDTSTDDFEAKYLELAKLGEGGFGSVYAGIRRSDDLPVAIKYIPDFTGPLQQVMLNGKEHWIPIEVQLMLQAAGDPATVEGSAAVSLLDWYDRDQMLILVMERPVPSMELSRFIKENNGPMAEDVAKIIMKQLVDAAIDLKAKGILHRDIKGENILIESSSDGLRVRVIDFGCGWNWVENTIYSEFSGTPAFAPPEFEFNKQYMAGPMTVWQLASVLFEMLDGFRRFFTTEFLRKELQISSVWSKDCQDFLGKCLTLEPEDRATLEEMKLHPWLHNPGT